METSLSFLRNLNFYGWCIEIVVNFYYDLYGFMPKLVDALKDQKSNQLRYKMRHKNWRQIIISRVSGKEV
jgi:hypothetical protein